MRMARGLEGHGVRRCALGVLSGLNEYSDAVISGDPGFGAAMSGHPRFHSGIPRRGIDDDSLPPHDVLALADHDVSGQRDRLGLHVVDAQIAAGILILADHGHIATGFGPADISSLRHGGGGLGLGGRGRGGGLGSVRTFFRPVEHDKGPTSPWITLTLPENVAVLSLSRISSVIASMWIG